VLPHLPIRRHVHAWPALTATAPIGAHALDCGLRWGEQLSQPRDARSFPEMGVCLRFDDKS
jgi:hypothetical protein